MNSCEQIDVQHQTLGLWKFDTAVRIVHGLFTDILDTLMTSPHQ
jgi:hypothetical protein